MGLSADAVCCAQGLNLQAVGAETDRRGFVPVDEKMQVLDVVGKVVPHLYCIGDANGKYMLAHAASAQGISAVENMVGRSHVLNHLSVPAACFTHPEVCAPWQYCLQLDMFIESVCHRPVPQSPAGCSVSGVGCRCLVPGRVRTHLITQCAKAKCRPYMRSLQVGMLLTRLGARCR